MDVAQVYPIQDEGDLEARLVGMRPNARQVAEVLGAEGRDEHDVPKVWVALQSKDWISAGTEIGLPLIDDVAKFQALGDYGLALSPAGSGPVIQRMTLEEKAEIVVTLSWISDCFETVETRVASIYDFGTRSLFFVRRNSRTGPPLLWQPRELPYELGAPQRSLGGKCLLSLACCLVRVPLAVHQLRSSRREQSCGGWSRSCAASSRVSVLSGRIQSIRTILDWRVVLNQTTDVSGAASTTVFDRGYAQTQREEAVVLKNARQHRESLADEAKRQNGGGRGRGE